MKKLRTDLGTPVPHIFSIDSSKADWRFTSTVQIAPDDSSLSPDSFQPTRTTRVSARDGFSDVGLDRVGWNTMVSGTALFPANVNNGRCDAGSRAGMACFTSDRMVDATMGGQFAAHFSVTGDLGLSEWSYRGEFDREDGWGISENSAPVPEPSTSLVFAELHAPISGGREFPKRRCDRCP